MVVVNLETIWFDVLNEGSIIDSGNLCPLWLVILKSVCNYSVRDTFSCDTVGHER